MKSCCRSGVREEGKSVEVVLTSGKCYWLSGKRQVLKSNCLSGKKHVLKWYRLSGMSE